MDIDYLVCLCVCHVINITTLETGVSQPVFSRLADLPFTKIKLRKLERILCLALRTLFRTRLTLLLGLSDTLARLTGG